MTVVLALAIFHSVEAVVWALVASAAFDFVVNMAAALPLAELRWTRALRTLLPIALVSAAMYAGVKAVTVWLADPSWLRFGLQIAVGIATYLGLSLLLRLEALRELWTLLQNQLRNKGKK